MDCNKWIPLTRAKNFIDIYEIKNKYNVEIETMKDVNLILFKCQSIYCPFALRATLNLESNYYEVDQKNSHDRYCKLNPKNPQYGLHNSSYSTNIVPIVQTYPNYIITTDNNYMENHINNKNNNDINNNNDNKTIFIPQVFVPKKHEIIELDDDDD